MDINTNRSTAGADHPVPCRDGVPSRCCETSGDARSRSDERRTARGRVPAPDQHGVADSRRDLSRSVAGHRRDHRHGRLVADVHPQRRPVVRHRLPGRRRGGTRGIRSGALVRVRPARGHLGHRELRARRMRNHVRDPAPERSVDARTARGRIRRTGQLVDGLSHAATSSSPLCAPPRTSPRRRAGPAISDASDA